jgi:hypothetical protein
LNANDYFNFIRDAIAPAHYKTASAGLLSHSDQLPNGKKYTFELNASVPHFAMSLDVPNCMPFGVFNAKTKGITCRCDLIIFCFHEDQPHAFLVEVKGSNNPGAAHHQIEAGAAFCRYLCELITITDTVIAPPKMFGLAVYALPRPRMGVTKPKPIQFVKQGKTNIPRADWDVGTRLPLTSLLAAAAA